jgi:hypothetical protein
VTFSWTPTLSRKAGQSNPVFFDTRFDNTLR